MRIRYRDLVEKKAWITIKFKVDLDEVEHIYNSFSQPRERDLRIPPPPYNLWLGIKIEESFLAAFQAQLYNPLDIKQDYGIIDYEGLEGVKMGKSLKIYSFQTIS